MIEQINFVAVCKLRKIVNMLFSAVLVQINISPVLVTCKQEKSVGGIIGQNISVK